MEVKNVKVTNPPTVNSSKNTHLSTEKLIPKNNIKKENVQNKDYIQVNADKLRKELEEAKQTLNKTLKALNLSVKVEIDDSTDKLVVKVIDRKTGKVIREHPPEMLLKFYKRMREALGLIVDDII